VFGQASGFAANIDLSTLDGTTGFKLWGEATYDFSGFSVASAGDVNGDGFADLIVGARFADPHGSESGASYVVFGQASGFAANIDLSTLDGATGFKLSGAAAYDRSGYSVASAGDVNGDGFADLVVGAYLADPHGSYSGASYVVFGKASGFAANVDLSTLDGTTGFKLSGAAAGDGSGRSVASAGDVNGDGFADLIVGAPFADPHGSNSGASYVVFGKLPDTAVNRTGTAAAQTLAGGDFNDTLSGLGGDDRLYGHAGNDTLDGGLGNDTIMGGAGADVMTGGAGNDIYVVDHAGDMVVENAGQGTDTVFSTAHLVLSANVENLTLSGGADLQGYGNSDANTLTGNAGSNLLDGRGGVDVMLGGAGNDVYVVDNAGDMVVENAGEGNDAVFSTAHLVLPANVEALVLQGSADLQGYGNNLANALFGNAGSNLLEGRGGADYMAGGAGNDVYIVDDAGDAVIENAGEGNDAVFSTAHLVLPANVEVLVLQGSADLQGYGNGDANKLYGNAGGNLLDGRVGADVMRGGAGNDVYIVDNAGDLVFENSGEGTDAVFASVAYTLTAEVETLVLQGSGNLAGGGNTLANKLYGNTGDNALDGGGGADMLSGNAGNDAFVFHAGEANGDTVLDFSSGDVLVFAGFGAGTFAQGSAPNQWVIHSGLGGPDETITIANGAIITPADFVFI
jgi:Ca2+-binding RTX toxin-like protein